MGKTVSERPVKGISRLFLAAVLATSVCLVGCGGGSQGGGEAGNAEEAVVSEEVDGSKETDGAGESADPAEEVHSSVEFDDLVIFENEDMTVWLESIYEDSSYYSSASGMGSYLTVKVRNNSDYEMLFYITDGYVGDDAVDLENGSFTIKAGKAKTEHLQVLILPDFDALESLDDIYDLEFTIEYSLEYEPGAAFEYVGDADIYFADVVPR